MSIVALVLLLAGLGVPGGHGASATSTSLAFVPIRTTVVRGEPVLLQLIVTPGSSDHVEVGESLVGVWEYEKAPRSWASCEGLSYVKRGPARVEVRILQELRPGKPNRLGLVLFECSQVLEAARLRARFRPEGTCCTSAPIDIHRIEGSDADRRARALGANKARETSSILAGYGLLLWQDLNRLYEDPVSSYRDRSYLGVPADQLQESVTELQQFLANFPKFPLARSLRLRLATELAVVGRRSEAIAELGRITPSTLEPHVAQDAARLRRELASGSDVPTTVEESGR